METVESCLDNLEVGSLVAVKLVNYAKEPVIGKVQQVHADSFTLQYWRGTYNGKWAPQTLPRSQRPWVDELPKSCIILCMFSLTDDNKLLLSTKRHLRDEYNRLANE